jgi:hypothetical protein
MLLSDDNSFFGADHISLQLRSFEIGPTLTDTIFIKTYLSQYPES